MSPKLAFVTKIFYMLIISGEGNIARKGEEGLIPKVEFVF